MKVEMLRPTYQKSFYGKALVYLFDDGWTYLQSYSTIMVAVRNGRLVRLSSAKSATTSRHIEAFLDTYADGRMDVKKFYTLKAESIHEHPEISEEQ